MAALTNITNLDLAPDTTDPPTWYIITILISIFGTLSFLLLITVHCLYRYFFTGSDILLLNLFALQLLMLSTTHPVWAHGTRWYQEANYLIAVNCRIFSLFLYTFTYCANWISFLLAINRMIAILIPHKYSIWSSRRVSFYMLVSAWLISLLVATIPLMANSGARYGPTPGMGFCTIIYHSKSTSGIILALGYGLPLTGLVILYSYMFIQLRISRLSTSSNIEQPSQASPSSKSLLMQRRVVLSKILFASCLFYSICFIPAPILSTYNYFGSPYLLAWLRSLFMVGMCGNPVIFLISNRDYQQTARSLFNRVLLGEISSRVTPDVGPPSPHARYSTN